MYAFSTENWSRPIDEVEDLMEIFGDTIERELPDLAKEGVRVRFVGRRDRAPDSCSRAWWRWKKRRARTTGCASGSASTTAAAQSSCEAVREIAASRAAPDAIDEELIAEHLYEPEMPDPDLLVRTSGELRISNFLLWQLAYAELVFTETLWPDFGADELRAALETFAQRRRRFGAR